MLAEKLNIVYFCAMLTCRRTVWGNWLTKQTRERRIKRPCDLSWRCRNPLTSSTTLKSTNNSVRWQQRAMKAQTKHFMSFYQSISWDQRVVSHHSPKSGRHFAPRDLFIYFFSFLQNVLFKPFRQNFNSRFLATAKETHTCSVPVRLPCESITLTYTQTSSSRFSLQHL